MLIPDPVRAPVLRRVFQLYAEGKLGTTAIARALDAEGAPAPRKQGWSPNVLQLILANPAYRGLIRWNGSLFEGLHEPLADTCNGERLPKERLEAAVLSQLAELYRDGRLIEPSRANAATLATKERPRVEEQLETARAEIARVERGHRERLESLRDEILATGSPEQGRGCLRTPFTCRPNRRRPGRPPGSAGSCTETCAPGTAEHPGRSDR
jgi:hypothetical protein